MSQVDSETNIIYHMNHNMAKCDWQYRKYKKAAFSFRGIFFLVFISSIYTFVMCNALTSVPTTSCRNDKRVMVAEVMNLLEPYLVTEDSATRSKVRKYVRSACASHQLSPPTRRSSRKRRRLPALDLAQCQLVLEYLEKQFQDETVCSILRSCPKILRRDVNNQISPAIEFFRDIYRDHNIVELAIQRNPNLLFVQGVGHHNHEKVADEVESFLLHQVGLSADKVNGLKSSKPLTFQNSARNLEEVCLFFIKILDSIPTSITNKFDKSKYSEKSMKVLRKMIINDPSLFACSVRDNLQPTIDFFLSKCLMDEKAVISLIKSCPALFGLSIEHNLTPKLDFFAMELGLKDNDLSRCMRKHPQILALSLKNLVEKASYFDAIDDATKDGKERSLAYRIASHHPAIYSLSLTENIFPKVDCLANIWGLQDSLPLVNRSGDYVAREVYSSNSRYTLSQLIGEYPGILSASLERNIIPTVSFFNSTGYLNLDENGCLISCVDSQPRKSIVRGRLLATSLYNTLLPRWHYLKDNLPHLNELSSPLELPPLYIFAGASDQKFCDYFELIYEDFIDYKVENIPKLKFSMQFVQWMKTGRPIHVE